MAKWQNSTRYFAFLATGSFLMAVITFWGVFLEADLTGRIIVGIVWTLVSLGWLGQYFRAKKTGQP